MTLPARIRTLARDTEAGFTMIIAIGVMFVSSLLLVAVFTAVEGDVHLSHESTIEKQAYYAALAGIQEYQFQLEKEPDYWQKCETPANTVPIPAEATQGKTERYEVNPLPANKQAACSSAKPFETMIESSGTAANTFRIESTGCAGVASLTTCNGQLPRNVAVRKIVATFTVTGFLQYVYFTRYEDEDPSLYNPKANCAQYYAARSSECQVITFVSGDSVAGPFHTDDTAVVCGTPEFGRKERKEKGQPDKVEINGGLHESCSSTPVFQTESGTYSKGRELIPPSSDESLTGYVEAANRFYGVTQLVLNGKTNTITVVNEGKEKSIAWPENGLIYVGKSKEGTCGFTFTGHQADGTSEKEKEAKCGTVYVHGTYSKSLTIGAENELVINGSVYPTNVEASLGTEPAGTAVLGLIATEFVRVYHPVQQNYAATKNSFGFYECKSGGSLNGTTCEFENGLEGCNASNLESAAEDTTNGWGTTKNIWIYAAILSTKHSFTVDNYNCGNSLEKLHVYGAIAQNFRGIVGTGGGGSNTGYLKDYKYDQRLASDEPPYFLQPLNTGWEVLRENAKEYG
jgi:hypothetical protein